ncbi:hypothetical protein MAR_015257 [Mya arenaria]|uniref:Uncharacterized protein n=1 Tax=Mya arenaria TaxID=6604 RepID=A0ABY7FGI1_MYAAR|nr:hypothetical protein MAR_015257 [Mya arenaria]
MNRVFCDIQSSKQWPISDKVAPVKITQYVSVSVVVGVTTHGQVVFTNKSTYQRPKENTQERMSQKILDPSPKWNPEKEIDIREFKKRIMDKTKLIIEAGVEQRSSIINLPLIGESGNEAKFPTPLRFCALAISEGLKRVCSRVPKPMTVQINTSSKLQANIIYETVKSFNWNTQADVGWTYWGQIGLPTIV